MTTPVEIWAPAFLMNCEQELVEMKASTKFDRKWLGKIENTMEYHTGTGLCCFLCEEQNITESREHHHKRHMKELDRYIKAQKKVAATEAEQIRLDNLEKARQARAERKLEKSNTA